MSKSSQATNFRQVDVDALDEDRFQDDAGEAQAALGPSESDIQNLLNSKRNSEALKMLLENPPYNAGASEKSRLFQLVLRVLMQFKTNEMDGTLKQFSQEQVDVLMKYIYKGFAEPTDNSCASLLNWHEKVHAVGGQGSIMRVLTSRKAV